MRLEWQSNNNRLYESGLDRGVLYPQEGPGVPWNGLISVEESPVKGERGTYYFDGIKYLEKKANQHFHATITAFSTPDEFGPCAGEVSVVPGFVLTNQPLESFGFSYRTYIDSGPEYKIHIVYNATATPDARGYSSLSAENSATNFSWNIDAIPPRLKGHRPSAHFVLDTTKTDLFTLRAVEDILYGTSTRAPRLPSAEELVDIVGFWEPKLIVPFYGDVIAADSPTAHWRVDDNNLSSTGVHDAISGPEVYLTEGAVLGGASGRMIYPEIKGAELTLEIWIKHDPALTNWAAAFARLSNDHHMIFQGNTSMKMFVATRTGPGPSGTLGGTPKILDQNWHQYVHVIRTATASAEGTCEQYVDGVWKKTFAHGLDTTTYGVDRTGNWTSVGGGGYPLGPWDEPAIYQYALTSEQIKKHYDAQKTDFTGPFALLTPGLGDLTKTHIPGLYRDLPTTRLVETSVGGLYRLE